MPSWQQRLQAVQRGGNLTVADLARWFDRPHSTVRTWVLQTARPGGGALDVEHAEALLGLLEELVRRRQGFPIPRLTGHDRVNYLVELRRRALP